MDKQVTIRKVDNGYVVNLLVCGDDGHYLESRLVYESIGKLLEAIISFFGEKVSQWESEGLMETICEREMEWCDSS